MSESTFTGPGEVLLAPDIWGDVVPIQMDGSTPWSIGKHAFLAATSGVTKVSKSQGFGKALCKCDMHILWVTKNSSICSFRRGSVCKAGDRNRHYLGSELGCHCATKTG